MFDKGERLHSAVAFENFGAFIDTDLAPPKNSSGAKLFRENDVIGPLQDPVTWYGINYTGMQMTQWDFQNKGKSGWTGTSSFVLVGPLRYLRPSVIYSVPCDRILQRAYFHRPCAQPRSQALSSLPPERGCHVLCFYQESSFNLPRILVCFLVQFDLLFAFGVLSCRILDSASLFILYVHDHNRLGFGMLTLETAVFDCIC